MKFSLLIAIVFVQICSTYAEALSVSCDNRLNVSSGAGIYRSLLGSEESIIYDLTIAASEGDIDFDSSRCREELMLIKEGIREKDAWTFKRKCSISSVINKQIPKDIDKKTSGSVCFVIAVRSLPCPTMIRTFGCLRSRHV
jgi:hypothetical protein